MGNATKASIICLAVAVAANVVAQVPSHEEEVVRSTYGTLSFLCGIQPPARAAIDQLHGHSVNQKRIDTEVANATPVFEITHVETGAIASIADQNWSTRFSFPESGTKNNVVLAGSLGGDGYGDETMKAGWRIARVGWRADDSYTPERIAAMQAITVGQAAKGGESAWTPGTYTRYATFQVAITFQGKTVGPYTASFFFGKDAKGNEVVAPQDAFVGMVLWSVLFNKDVYPSQILTSKLRDQPVMAQWIQANRAQSCSSSRSDLCCEHGKCALPDAHVARDLATPLNHSN